MIRSEPGILPGTEHAWLCRRKKQKTGVRIAGFCAVCTHGAGDFMGQEVSQHPITPDDLRMWIAPADFLKKCDDSPLKPLRILHLGTPKLIEPLAENRHCLRIKVRVCVKGSVVIGTKIYNDNVGRVGREIKHVMGMRQDILPAACDTADLLIEARKDTVRIILVIRHNTCLLYTSPSPRDS